MIIEKATIEDAEELLDIYAPYVTDTAISFEYEVPTIEEFKTRIEQISSRYPYIKAIKNGQIKESRIDKSVRRIIYAKIKRGEIPPDTTLLKDNE